MRDGDDVSRENLRAKQKLVQFLLEYLVKEQVHEENGAKHVRGEHVGGDKDELGNDDGRHGNEGVQLFGTWQIHVYIGEDKGRLRDYERKVKHHDRECELIVLLHWFGYFAVAARLEQLVDQDKIGAHRQNNGQDNAQERGSRVFGQHDVFCGATNGPIARGVAHVGFLSAQTVEEDGPVQTAYNDNQEEHNACDHGAVSQKFESIRE